MATATYYILGMAIDKKTCRIVMHINVPDIKNRADVKLSEALVEFLGGAESITSSVVGGDETALKAGSKYEHIESLRFSSTHLTDEEREAEVEARVTQILADPKSELSEILEQLKFWRKSDTITV